ncbi:unnamed protein product, partial [Brenthis ino]
MIFSTTFSLYILFIAAVGGRVKYNRKDEKNLRCLTGYMTDLQSWVDEYGSLINTTETDSSGIDLSGRNNVFGRLQHQLDRFSADALSAKYLSMARCSLLRIPSIFKMVDKLGRSLSDTLEYASFYGNNFGMVYSDSDMYDVRLNATERNEINVSQKYIRKQLTMWSVGFHGFTFPNLKELDLRSCSIQAIGNYSFQRMPRLQSLFLGENEIHYIEANVFNGLTSLKHLDLSRNYAYDENGMLKGLQIDSQDILENINLESLDLSLTNFGQRNVDVIKSIEHSVIRMSLCYSGISRIREDVFSFKRLKYLDVSGNREICSFNFLRSFEQTLEVLYAEDVGMKNMEGFINFTKLEILKLTNNEITQIPKRVAYTLINLQILDLDSNRLGTWFSKTLTRMNNLKLLSLRNNNIKIITEEMFFDIEKLAYISLSGNSLVCNCYAKEMFNVGLNSEMRRKEKFISRMTPANHESIYFHTGFMDYNDIIDIRQNILTQCKMVRNCQIELPSYAGNYLFLDYDDLNTQYLCMSADDGKSEEIFRIPSCSRISRDLLSQDIEDEWNKFLLFIIPVALLPMLLFVYIFRRNFKYFFITLRNSATLSLINKNSTSAEGAIYHYDVFVSYCNEDRAWVLDQLLPHVERDCNISVCLHERDFQVGLSILENIVSCMDRSRSIMLIISKRFLLSQWCQFEMHLAQHRLLETRREDLILVLLEEIPRRLRPNTLHYLMLTKTYIVWPKEESEQSVFWRRMKKSLVTQVLKYQENISLA